MVEETRHNNAVPLSHFLKALGERLTAYRISRDLKQSDLAEKAGINRTTLSRLETGRGTLDTFVRVLRALELEDRLESLIPEATVSPLSPNIHEHAPRRRVRSTSSSSATTGWSWGDEDPQ